MTSTDAPTVDNGVNIEALRGARQALTDAPEAAQFQWRATCEWVRGTHSRSTITEFSGLGQSHTHRQPYEIEADHPEVFASEDNGATPPEIVLAALGVVPDRGRGHGRDEPRRAAPVGEGDREGRHGPAGHPRHRRRRAQRLRDRSRSPTTSTPTLPRRPRGDRRPVAEALGGVRHRRQPDDGARRARLSPRRCMYRWSL